MADFLFTMRHFKTFLDVEELSKTRLAILYQKRCNILTLGFKKQRLILKYDKRFLYWKIKHLLDIFYDYFYVLQKKINIHLLEQVRILLLKLYYLYNFKNAQVYYEKFFGGYIFCSTQFYIPTKSRQKKN